MKRLIVISIGLAAALTMMTACSAVSTITATDAPTSPNVTYPEQHDAEASSAPVEAEPESTEPEPGSLENPFPKGYTATITQDDEDYYSVTFDLIAADGDKKVAEANQFNDKAPKGYHYVIIKATFTGLSSEAVRPGSEMYDWQIADQDGNLYQPASVVPVGESISGAPDLYKGQKFSGEEVYAVADSAKKLFMSALGSYLLL
ncbi:hypothetical protein GCM10022240_27120 [Microbacterium kribbense]|uniref:Lipoprotein n=1 Tax=Microbacterium kribbense TaxID=433645 RepID=A0ABP7GRG1_9MICO